MLGVGKTGTVRASATARSARSQAIYQRYAAVLYRTLHELDAASWEWIEIEPPPETPEWASVLYRLRRMPA